MRGDGVEQQDVPWELVTGSSDVRAFRVIGEDLYIRFQRDVTYRYHAVPADIIDGFRTARSKGRYIGQYLKVRAYRPERIDDGKTESRPHAPA